MQDGLVNPGYAGGFGSAAKSGSSMHGVANPGYAAGLMSKGGQTSSSVRSGGGGGFGGGGVTNPGYGARATGAMYAANPQVDNTYLSPVVRESVMDDYAGNDVGEGGMIVFVFFLEKKNVQISIR